MLDRLPIALTMLFFAATATAQTRDEVQIHMVTFRGCEEACQGFRDYFADRRMPVEVIVTDIARDTSRLPEIRNRLVEERPDLVVTWGTSVSTAIIGTMDEHGTETALGDIPVLFMIVADPLSSNLIASAETSGRPTVTGVRNRVPERAQMRTIFEYMQVGRLGVLNAPGVTNSRINTEKIRVLAKDMGFELIEALYESSDPDPAEIPGKIAELAKRGAEAIYVGSSSFNLQHSDIFTAAALAEGLPVFSAYEQMVTSSDALMSVSNSYVNVGKLAARQAARIVLDEAKPGGLPIATLDRFAILINMRVAKTLELYPPIQLVSIAEIVE